MLYNEEIDAQKVFESSTFFLDQKKKNPEENTNRRNLSI